MRSSLFAPHSDRNGRNPLKVNLGCGLIAPAGWVNVDGSLNARLAKHPTLRRVAKRLKLISADIYSVPWNPNLVIHDVSKPLPFSANSASAVYASHLLEHLYLEEAKALLRDCYRVLLPGGVLRIVVPDLRHALSEYFGSTAGDYLGDSVTIPTRADKLNERLGFHSKNPPPRSVLYRIALLIRDYGTHKWMYDSESLIGYFRWSGFSDATEKGFRESLIPGIEDVEKPERVLGGAGICVEATKIRDVGSL